jgi:hypothetical protein
VGENLRSLIAAAAGAAAALAILAAAVLFLFFPLHVLFGIVVVGVLFLAAAVFVNVQEAVKGWFR